jgi:hypothetical protein
MSYTFTDRRLLKTPMPDAQLSSMASLEKSDNNAVATPSLSYQRMRAWWDVIEAIRGGTSKMRELGEAYLPKEPGEGNDAYHRRLSRVVLAPWYTRLVRGLVGMVLRKPIKVDSDKLRQKEQELLTEHLEDVNLQGDNLQTFAKDVFESAIDYNYSGILVEYPDTSGLETQADEAAMGVRPYWVLYAATDILGLRWQQIGAQRVLTQVRLKQTVTEETGEFGEEEIEQVLVYDRVNDEEIGYRVRWRIFRETEEKGKKKVWILHNEGLLSLPEIPFALCYTDKKCRLELQPPMLEVAHLNVRHYQLSADLDHALHIASVPRMFIFGASPEEIGAMDSIDEAVCIPRAEARVEWSSAKLDSFAPLQSRITEVEGQMSALGLSTLVSQKNVGESAEAKRLDRTQGDSIMAVIAQSLQNALNQALYFHLQYLNIQEKASCSVSRDFDLSQMDAQMIGALYQVRQGGDLSQETFLGLLKQGEIGLPDDWTVEDEIERLKAAFEAQTKTQLPAKPEDEPYPQVERAAKELPVDLKTAET